MCRHILWPKRPDLNLLTLVEAQLLSNGKIFLTCSGSGIRVWKLDPETKKWDKTQEISQELYRTDIGLGDVETYFDWEKMELWMSSRRTSPNDRYFSFWSFKIFGEFDIPKPAPVLGMKKKEA